MTTGITYFSIEPSLSSLIINSQGDTTSAITNHGFMNAPHFGLYVLIPYKSINYEFEINRLKKEYQFSFINNSYNNTSKGYKIDFLLNSYYITIHKALLEFGYKSYLDINFMSGLGFGLNESTPIVNNDLFNKNDTSFVFNGDGEPDMVNGILSIRKLQNEIENQLFNKSFNIHLQTAFKVRVIDLEFFLLYRYTWPTESINGIGTRQDLIKDIPGFRSINFRIGIFI